MGSVRVSRPTEDSRRIRRSVDEVITLLERVHGALAGFTVDPAIPTRRTLTAGAMTADQVKEVVATLIRDLRTAMEP